jgi:hypothetical protein
MKTIRKLLIYLKRCVATFPLPSDALSFSLPLSPFISPPFSPLFKFKLSMSANGVASISVFHGCELCSGRVRTWEDGAVQRVAPHQAAQVSLHLQSLKDINHLGIELENCADSKDKYTWINIRIFVWAWMEECMSVSMYVKVP